jgi:type II secretory pathway pseudopilin PulG
MRAQTSVELLAIVIVAVVVIVGLYFVSQTYIADVGKTKETTEAKGALADISAAAKEVYSQGYGARKKVYITMPSGVDPLGTRVENTSLVLRVSGNDYVESEQFEMHGTIPTTQGGHYVWVVSEGNKVRIGYAMIELSRQSLLITLMPNQSATKQFDITNIWSAPINVTIDDSWDPGNLTFSLDANTASLIVDESETFTATAITSNEAVGIYLKDMQIVASDSSGNSETITFPVIVQVVHDPNKRPPLVAIPPLFNETMNRSDNATREFQICTNRLTSVNEVNFSPSVGEPGEWVSGLSSIGPIARDSCVPKFLTVSVPNDSAIDNFTGFVSLTSDVVGAEDSIALNIEVGGGGDLEGPIVRNITTSERRVHVFSPTTILAVADDNSTGGSRIRSCAISADSGPWEYMFPTDGNFDSSIENVSYTYFSGFDVGPHNVSINCTDWPGNIGPTSNYTFVIGKHILFVVSSGNQSDWSDWITVHYSEAGHSWDFDVADFNDVINGLIDMSYYDAVIFIDWSSNEDFVNLVDTYMDDGGFLGLFGDSAHNAVRDLNLTWHPDNPHPETHVNIMNNTHYVTSPFSTGLLEISSDKTKIYSVWGDPANTTELGSSGWFFPDTDRVYLAQVDQIMFWGPEDPWALNENGVTIATRVIDWMINQSMIG